MTQNLLLTILAFVISLNLSGQVVINDSTFPDEGDTVKVYTVTTPQFDVKADVVGESSWKYTLPTTANYSEVVFQPAASSSNSSSFPNAELVVNSGGIELFYDIETEAVSEIGIITTSPILGQIDVNTHYIGKRVIRRAPIEYGMVYTNSHSVPITAATEELPDQIKNALLQFQADSVRVEGKVTVIEDADAYGNFELGPDNFEVLRVKKTRYADADLYIKAPLIGWVLVPLENLPGDLTGVLPSADTTVTYEFIANNEIEPIAEVTMNADNDAAITGLFLGDKVRTSTEEQVYKDQFLSAYPNPTYGDVTFTLENTDTRGYKVEIYNIIGKRLKSFNFKNGKSSIEVNLSDLSKGTYLYSVIDPKGRKLSTRRLIIINP